MTTDEFRHEMLNQALKGILAGFGHGSGATRKGVPLTLSRSLIPGDALVPDELAQLIQGRTSGCYLVVASKVVALAERRLVTVPKYPLPPRRSPHQLLNLLRSEAGEIGEVTFRDALGADLIEDNGVSLTFALLPQSPNDSAFRIAESLRSKCGLVCDVVITDTSAGWTKGQALIGVPTFLATPIGMTMGVDIYYGQRLAALAEAVRNEVPNTPYVLVEPPTDRSRTRENCGHRRAGAFVFADGREAYLA